MESSSNHQSSDDTGLLFGADDVLLFVGYLLRAVRRNLKLALLCFVGTLSLAGVAVSLMSPTYRIETRILTSTSYVIPALTTPTRSVPWQPGASVRGAAEVIKGREFLRSVVEEADLLRRWRETRTKVGLLKDEARALLFGVMDDATLREALLSVLERQLAAHVEGDVIRVNLEWHEPESATVIVQTVHKRFLEVRLESELSEIQDTVSILEKKLTASSRELRSTAERLRVAMDSVRRRPGRSRRQTAWAPASRGEQSERHLELAQAQRELELRSTQRAELEGAYHEGVREAQEELESLLQTLGSSHPDVVASRRRLEERSRPPRELARLQAEEAQLVARTGRLQRLADPGAALPTELTTPPPQLPVVEPTVEEALRNFNRAQDAYTDLNNRLEDARIEVESATAAFRYRYIVTQPPVQPRSPIRPRKVSVMIAAVIGATMLAMVLAILAEIRTRRIVEPWQLQRVMGLNVLGEISEPER